MLGVDLKHVAVAESCREVWVVNDKIGCQEFATVKQSALFNKDHKEHHIKT